MGSADFHHKLAKRSNLVRRNEQGGSELTKFPVAGLPGRHGMARSYGQDEESGDNLKVS